jgi:glycosyltransferase involved in cell wall biosynthesis
MNALRIGIVVPGFSANESDWCIPALTSLVRRLAEEHRVRVFALRYPPREGCYPVFSSEVRAFGGADVKGLARIPFLLRVVAAIREEHRREPFDVLHGIWADEPGYVAVRAARGLGVPSVVTLFGGELVAIREIAYGGLRSRLNRFLVARALRGASQVTAGSRRVAEMVRERRREPRLLPIGVDLNRFTPGEGIEALLPGPAGGAKLLHVASLVGVKDQRTLLRAFARVHRAVPDASLHLVGKGPLEASLRARARELGVGGRTFFHGAVAHDALASYYRSADLLVMSSLHESQELVTQEAAACGRTTVGTRVGVVADLVPATTAVAPSNPDALAEGILDALLDRARLRERERMGRRKVVESYSLERTVADFISLYRHHSKEVS